MQADKRHDRREFLLGFQIGKHERAIASHLFAIALHDAQIRPDKGS